MAVKGFRVFCGVSRQNLNGGHAKSEKCLGGACAVRWRVRKVRVLWASPRHPISRKSGKPLLETGVRKRLPNGGEVGSAGAERGHWLRAFGSAPARKSNFSFLHVPHVWCITGALQFADSFFEFGDPRNELLAGAFGVERALNERQQRIQAHCMANLLRFW